MRYLFGLLALLAAALLGSGHDLLAKGGIPRAGSRYTDLDLDRCTRLSFVEEGESVEWRCPGHAGIALFVSSGDGRFDVDAGVRNQWFETQPPFNQPGPRVEWRVRTGRPFAIIHRLMLLDGNRRGHSVLGVSRIGRSDAPGCLVGWIDGDMPNANQAARDLADRTALRFRCGRDSPELVGRVR